MEIRWLEDALADLDAIYDYVAGDNPQAAEHTFLRIRDAVRSLADHPHGGRPGRVPGTREFVTLRTPYVVPYRVRDEAVEILRVLHGARKWPGNPS